MHVYGSVNTQTMRSITKIYFNGTIWYNLNEKGRFLPEVHSVQFGVSIQVHETVFRHDKFNTTYDLQKLTLNIHKISLHEEILKMGDDYDDVRILWCASLQFPICWINNYHDIDEKEMKIKKPRRDDLLMCYFCQLISGREGRQHWIQQNNRQLQDQLMLELYWNKDPDKKMLKKSTI
jgi:hypothetical protein